MSRPLNISHEVRTIRRMFLLSMVESLVQADHGLLICERGLSYACMAETFMLAL